jgi:cobalt-zinc-cadmium efflux system protein
LLKAGSGESLNVKGAYLEVWSDMLGSLGVLIAAALIKLTGWLILDPILAVLIGLGVLPRTWTLAREAMNVLLEGVPHGTDLPAVRTAILGQRGDRRSRSARLGAGVQAGGLGGARDRRHWHGRGCAPTAHQ